MSGTWAAGWATGDVVTAAEYKKQVGMIADATTVGGAALSAPGLVGGYAHLDVIVKIRGDSANGEDNLLLQFNGDSTATYDYQLLTANFTTVTAAGAGGATGILLGQAVGGAAAANKFTICRFTISSYADAQFKQIAFQTFGFNNAKVWVGGGQWESTAAITQIAVSVAAGVTVAGSRMTVYARGS